MAVVEDQLQSLSHSRDTCLEKKLKCGAKYSGYINCCCPMTASGLKNSVRIVAKICIKC